MEAQLDGAAGVLGQVDEPRREGVRRQIEQLGPGRAAVIADVNDAALDNCALPIDVADEVGAEGRPRLGLSGQVDGRRIQLGVHAAHAVVGAGLGRRPFAAGPVVCCQCSARHPTAARLDVVDHRPIPGDAIIELLKQQALRQGRDFDRFREGPLGGDDHARAGVGRAVGHVVVELLPVARLRPPTPVGGAEQVAVVIGRVAQRLVERGRAEVERGRIGGDVGDDRDDLAIVLDSPFVEANAGVGGHSHSGRHRRLAVSRHVQRAGRQAQPLPISLLVKDELDCHLEIVAAEVPLQPQEDAIVPLQQRFAAQVGQLVVGRGVAVGVAVELEAIGAVHVDLAGIDQPVVVVVLPQITVAVQVFPVVEQRCDGHVRVVVAVGVELREREHHVGAEQIGIVLIDQLRDVAQIVGRNAVLGSLAQRDGEVDLVDALQRHVLQGGGDGRGRRVVNR